MKKDNILLLAAFMFLVLMLLGAIYIEILCIKNLEKQNQEFLVLKEKFTSLNDKYESFKNTKIEIDSLNEEKNKMQNENYELKERISKTEN